MVIVSLNFILVSSCHFHHDHCGSSARYRKIKARPYRSGPSVRVWPYPSGLYPPVFPFFGTPEEIGHLGNSPYQDELTEFMPCGQPGILLGQIIPEEISTLILDLEHEKMCKETSGNHNSHAGGQTTILVDDSFLKNGKNLNFSSPRNYENILDLDEMNDIIPLIKTEPKDETENLNDSGIVIDTKLDENQSAVAPQPSVSSTPVQNVPEKKHQCQFCQKPYQSISGLKYHLKKASNECSIKFKAKTILN